MHALSGHVDGTTSSAVIQLKVGTMEEEKSGGIIAAVEGGEEKRCLTLSEKS